MALGLSSLLMISLSFMGMAPSLAQGDEQDRPSDGATTQPSPFAEDAATDAAAEVNETPSESPTWVESPTEPRADELPATTNPGSAEKPASPGQDEPSVDADETAAVDDGIVPMLVPPATGNDAVITVKVGGSRTSPTAVSNLAGVTLGLFANANDSSPVAEFGTCVSDSDGDCSFIVPDTQARKWTIPTAPAGANNNRRFYVKQIAAPTSHFTSPSLGTSVVDPYVFQTGTSLRSGQTYRSNNDFMYASSNTNSQASTGMWQNSLVNPNFPQKCGIDVGIVMDLSNSLSAADLSNMKLAANGFVDALTGTPSSVGTFTFATRGPASTGHTLAPVSVSSQAGANTVKSKIGTYQLPGGNAGGTNWDEGFYQVVQSASDFDVVVIITDGNPTFSLQGTGPGNSTRFTEVENGIFSANAIKASGGPEGTRVIAFGVGSGVSSTASGLNLRAISGPTLNSDYYQSASFAAAGEQLKELALGNCKGSVTVVKQVIPVGGTTNTASPAGGWRFTGQGSPEVTVNSPTVQDTAPGTGAANFPLTFDTTFSTGPVTLTETPKPGYTLQQIGGKNATCKRVGTNTVVPSTNVENGFTVTGNPTYPITCTVYNKQLDPATLTLKKVVEKGTTGAPGIPANWTLMADGPTPVSGPGNSASVTNQTVGVGTYTLSETGGPGGYDASSWSCTGGGVLTGNSLALTYGDNATCTITNTAKQSKLTLIKTVTNDNGGTALPGAWTLNAVGPTQGVTGATGVPAVTGRTVEIGSYKLSETGPSGYDASNWSCTGGNLVGDTVTVGLGANVTCTINNDDQPAELTLIKTVTNDDGGTANPADWILTATNPTTSISGSVGEPEVTNASVPAGSYNLAESGGRGGYTAGSWSCTGGTLSGSTVSVGLGANVICTINNDDQPAKLTLKKVVENDPTGAGAGPSDWKLTAAGPTPITGAGNSPPVSNQTVDAGSYTLSEGGGPSGYTASAWSCGDVAVTNDTVVVPNGGDVTCTITNTVVQPTLTLVKDVRNNDVTGGTGVPSDWTLKADGPSLVTGVGESTAVLSQPVKVGEYSLSESGGPAGYEGGLWSCTGAESSSTDSVTIAPGNNAVCTVINTSVSANLTLVKVVDNGDSGATAEADDWTLTATAENLSTVSGTTGTSGAVKVGTYDLSEAGPDGYDASEWVCTGAASSTANTVTVGLANNAVCTITNTAKQPHLTLVKTVINNNGGTSQASAWTLTADGRTKLAGDGGTPRTPVAVGDYALAESAGPGGYTASDWVCDSGTLTGSTIAVGLGDDVTCTIVNDDQAAALTLVKMVDNGGTGVEFGPGDWTLSANSETTDTSVSGPGGSADVQSQVVDAGVYDLAEDGPAGYTASDWTCGDVPVNGSTVVVPNGGDVTCTVTNTADQPTLTLIKTVTNDSGGTAAPTDWTLTATGPTTGITGPVGDDAVTDVAVEVGSYVLAESDGPDGYTAGAWNCLAGGATVDVDVVGGVSTVPVALGEDVTCTVNNDDDAANLTLVKVVDNGDTGATTAATEWMLSAAGPTPISGVTSSTAVTNADVDAGSYDLSEDGPAGYSASDWVCGGATVTDSTVVVPNGGDVTCTITNVAEASFLTLVKTVTNNNGGSSEPSAWTLKADGTTQDGTTQSVSGLTGTPAVTRAVVAVGDYALSEAGPGGYNAGDWTCTVAVDDGTEPVDVGEGDIVSVGVGQDITCTINNDDQTQILIEKWGSDADGVKGPIDGASFEVRANNGGTPGALVGAVTPVPGEPGVFKAAAFDPGIYWLVETKAPAGYSLLAAPIGFTIEDDGTLTILGNNPQAEIIDATANTLALRITDNAAISLPLTGGASLNFVALALVVLGIGGFGVALIRRQRPQRITTSG